MRLLHDLEEGSIDMACTLFNTHDRAPGALYVSIPRALEEIYLIRMAPEDATVSSGAALEDILLGGVRGYYYGPQQLSGLTLYNDDSQLPLNLINHRVQAVLSNLPTFRYFARAEGISDEAWVADPVPWFSGPIYMAFSRNREDSHELAAEFTKALVELRKTEAYQAISDRYDLHAPPF